MGAHFHWILPRIRLPSPEGRFENSPPFQGWDRGPEIPRPGGTAESIRAIRPSLRDFCDSESVPGSELPGYSRISLREIGGASPERPHSTGCAKRSHTAQRASKFTFALLLLAAQADFAANAAMPKPSAASTNHWAFQPVVRPSIPAVQNKSWPRTPIDFFILAKLEEKGLAPSPPADKATLLRRVTFDLHGLPPSPAELDAFLADASPDALAKVVDRLLASPRYGERWARHWLDLARFSESDGFEYDKMREHAWRYRDYVIRSLNEDKPYARFVAEQIAGDALEPVTLEGIAATGFLVAGPYDEAGNTSVSLSLKARIREEEMEDIIAAVGQTFLGVTVNCARCHDHKFDPISQTDYYRFKAALDGVRHGNRPFAAPAEIRARDEKLDSLKAGIAELESKITAIESTVRARVAADVRRRNEGKTSAKSNAILLASPLTPAPSPLRGEGEKSAVNPPPPLARWTFESDANDSIGTLHGMLAGGAVVSGGRP